MTVEAAARDIRAEVAKAISGQERTIEQVLAAVLADGHVLLEGVPGVAKTLLVRSMAHVLGLGFGRVQFTPDLMPSDVLGTSVLDPRTNSFEFRRGPIFTSVLLADEINRTPPKTQSALLEAMEERRATVDGVTHKLPEPFLVFATQNPLDFEGTYPLPEAQQDRFLLKILVDYPAPASEIQVLKRHHTGFRPQRLEDVGLRSLLTLEDLKVLRSEVQATTVEEKVFDYIYGIVSATRRHDDLLAGASPRAGIALLNVSKAVARLRGRDYVIPDDVKELAVPVLRHRLVLRPEAEVEGISSDRVLADLLEAQIVPR
ncbi:MoxR family ATPase [bacterium]|nr:MAG: MoxR family ATPase [bacterium]